MRSFGRKKKRGYTLIELLVSMAVSMVVLAALSSSFISQNKAFHVQEQVNEMQQNARAAIDLMAREIKMAGYDPTGIGFAAIQTFAAGQFRFIADLDGNGVTTNPNEDLDYSLDAVNNQILRKDNGAAGVPIVENITAVTFQYLDAAGLVTAVAAEIRQIQITITARTSNPDPDYPDNGGYRIYSLSTLVTPINLAL